MLDHHRLDVYRHSLDLIAAVDSLSGRMPKGRSHLRDQLDRAATSITLNIAEGAGEFSKDEKQRFYRIARRSAIEVAAVLDIVERRRVFEDDELKPVRDLIVRIVSMLVRLISR